VRRVKLLVFAHTPPPHHGQSYMVELLLEGLRNDPAFEILHVNVRLSSGTEDIGAMRMGKVFPLLTCCARAILWRFQSGARVFYYVPANPSRAATMRDWIVMLLCRPFFSKCVFHWHAAGLARWLKEVSSPLQRELSRRLLTGAALSIVLSQYNRSDAEFFRARRIEVIPNGIPDPCPEFTANVLPARCSRLSRRKSAAGGSHFRILYIGLCLREKGLFDAIEAVRLANEAGNIQFALTVAGTFWHRSERAEFDRLCTALRGNRSLPQLEYVGFVSGQEKARLFMEADCLVFPTYYNAESFGLVLIEAMAHGLPVVTTNWRMIPEVLPADYPGLVEPKAPKQIALRLTEAVTWDCFEKLRGHYLANFTVEGFWRKMKAALLSV